MPEPDPTAVMGPQPDPARNAAILPMAGPTNAPVINAPSDSGGATAVNVPATSMTPAPATAVTSPAAGVLPTTRPGTPVQNPDRERALGKAVKFLLGSTTQYSVDPQTGKTVATDVPNKPGDLFRHILAGAILGGAAGAKAKDFTAGLGEGAGAEQEQLRNVDQRDFARAQEQLKNQREAQQAEREGRVLEREDKQLEFERTKFNAQMAQWDKENILRHADLNLRNQEQVLKENELEQNMEKWVIENGGIAMSGVPKNGEMGNEQDMMKLFAKNPNKFAPPAGYSSMTIAKVDTTGLKYDFSKNGWQDEQGNAVDLATRTSWTVYAVPQNSNKTPISMSGADIMKQFPSVFAPKSLDAKKTYPLTISELAALGTQQRSTDRLEFDEQFKQNHQAVAAKLAEYTKGIADLTREATNARTNGQDEEAAQFDKQIADMQQELDDYLENANPAMRGTYRDGVNKVTGTATNQKRAGAQTGPDIGALQQKVAQMPGGWDAVSKKGDVALADKTGKVFLWDQKTNKKQVQELIGKGDYATIPPPTAPAPVSPAQKSVADIAHGMKETSWGADIDKARDNFLAVEKSKPTKVGTERDKARYMTPQGEKLLSPEEEQAVLKDFDTRYNAAAAALRTTIQNSTSITPEAKQKLLGS